MRLSQVMIEHLRWCAGIEDIDAEQRARGTKTRIRLGRATHYANRQTHDALVRRGLMGERGRYTFVTKAGRALLSSGVEQKGKER